MRRLWPVLATLAPIKPAAGGRGRRDHQANAAGTACAGTFFFIDPKDDRFAICLMQSPSLSERITTELKTLIYRALRK